MSAQAVECDSVRVGDTRLRVTEYVLESVQAARACLTLTACNTGRVRKQVCVCDARALIEAIKTAKKNLYNSSTAPANSLCAWSLGTCN